jgi:sugar phosphate isomerase/epimerase
MGFWHSDLKAMLTRYKLKEMKTILADNGITDVEVEWLLDWYASGERRAASDLTRKLLLDAAETFGARHIKVADLGNDCAGLPQMTEEFARLCREAGERGTKVMFEMLPSVFSRLPSLEQVLVMCRGAGARNGGILLDNLHVQRIGTSLQDIVQRIDPHIPLGVEINDGLLGMPVNLQDSVVNKRLLPGDGEFDISAFLHAVWDRGYDGPVGVEVLNQYIRRWPLELAASEAFDKTRRVVDEARRSWEAKRH